MLSRSSATDSISGTHAAVGTFEAHKVDDSTDGAKIGRASCRERVESAVQVVKSSEKLTQVYTVTLADGKAGDQVTQDVTVTITGTNDKAQISVVDVTGAVQEDVAVSATLTLFYSEPLTLYDV